MSQNRQKNLSYYNNQMKKINKLLNPSEPQNFISRIDHNFDYNSHHSSFKTKLDTLIEYTIPMIKNFNHKNQSQKSIIKSVRIRDKKSHHNHKSIIKNLKKRRCYAPKK